MLLDERVQRGRHLVQRRVGIGQTGCVPTAQLDADVADAVERVVEDRYELVAQLDRPIIRRLDRGERAAHPAQGVLLL